MIDLPGASSIDCDVLIVGGGIAGASLGALIGPLLSGLLVAAPEPHP